MICVYKLFVLIFYDWIVNSSVFVAIFDQFLINHKQVTSCSKSIDFKIMLHCVTANPNRKSLIFRVYIVSINDFSKLINTDSNLIQYLSIILMFEYFIGATREIIQ